MAGYAGITGRISSELVAGFDPEYLRSSFGDFKSTDDYLWFYYSVIEKNAGRLHHSYIYHWSSGKSWNCHGIINDIDQVAIGLRPMTTTPDGEMVFRVNTSKTNPESDTIVLAIVTMKEG